MSAAPPAPSPTHLVLIPSFNTGPRLVSTVEEARRHWAPVWVVIDGSTDGSAEEMRALAKDDPQLRLIERRENGGKGAAVETGAAAAAAAGFTHVLVMDADGQHPAPDIPRFMTLSAATPAALVCGVPIFDETVPRERLYGRKLSVGLVWLELFGPRIRDSLFGFRVYPVRPLLQAFASTPWGRSYDFDTELAVRLVWNGAPTLNVPAAVRYFQPSEGGVSHFHYVRDNLRLSWMHARLLSELLLWRWPSVWRGRRAQAKS